VKKKTESRVEKAFAKSDKHVLEGVILRPWTPDRQIAFQSCGGLYPRIGKEGWDQYKRTGAYAGAANDCCLALWLMTRSEDEVDDAVRSPHDAGRQARKWGANRGIHDLKSDAFWQAFTKFVEIMSEVEASNTTPEGDGDEGDDPNG
jgi:hypothetical protein